MEYIISSNNNESLKNENIKKSPLKLNSSPYKIKQLNVNNEKDSYVDDNCPTPEKPQINNEQNQYNIILESNINDNISSVLASPFHIKRSQPLSSYHADTNSNINDSDLILVKQQKQKLQNEHELLWDNGFVESIDACEDDNEINDNELLRIKTRHYIERTNSAWSDTTESIEDNDDSESKYELLNKNENYCTTIDACEEDLEVIGNELCNIKYKNQLEEKNDIWLNESNTNTCIDACEDDNEEQDTYLQKIKQNYIIDKQSHDLWNLIEEIDYDNSDEIYDIDLLKRKNISQKELHEILIPLHISNGLFYSAKDILLSKTAPSQAV